jgi:hypothetical protein
MHSVPTQKHRRNPTSRLSLLAPEFAPQHPGLSYSTPLSLDNESHLHKSRPSSNRVFAFPPLIFLPLARKRKPTQKRRLAECRCPHNPTTIAPGHQDWLYLKPSTPNDKAQARIPCPGAQSAKLLMPVLRLCSRAEAAKRSVSGRMGTPVLYLEASRHPRHLTNNRADFKKNSALKGNATCKEALFPVSASLKSGTETQEHALVPHKFVEFAGWHPITATAATKTGQGLLVENPPSPCLCRQNFQNRLFVLDATMLQAQLQPARLKIAGRTTPHTQSKILSYFP